MRLEDAAREDEVGGDDAVFVEDENGGAWGGEGFRFCGVGVGPRGSVSSSVKGREVYSERLKGPWGRRVISLGRLGSWKGEGVWQGSDWLAGSSSLCSGFEDTAAKQQDWLYIDCPASDNGEPVSENSCPECHCVSVAP